MPSRIAYHEAGHAAVSLALGVAVRGLEVSRTGGSVRYPKLALRMTEDSRIITAAGPAAECRGIGRICPADLGVDATWESDARILADLVAIEFSGPDVRRAYQNAIQDAETMVDALWPQIERLAEAAGRRGWLSADCIRALVDVPLFNRRRLSVPPDQLRIQEAELADLYARQANRSAAREQRAGVRNTFLPWDVRARAYASEYTA